ncbi:hypothetical protein ACFL5V_03825 [Fibrobacterota bacterium]
MKFKYIGPVPSRRVEEAGRQIKDRREYEQSIRAMKKDLAIIERSLKYAGTK